MPELFKTTLARQIRVFISSTFLDLEEERNYLVKVVFPRIRKLCQQRNIEFTEIDLRWGVTEEESKQGKVIHICLSEIDRSHPYFIGILGNRYGWIPTKGDLNKYQKILEDFSWVNRDIEMQMSITEMEIQYGVLRNNRYRGDSKPHAFFYIKSGEGENQIVILNEGELHQKKLRQLKEHLKHQSHFPVYDFIEKEDLGERVSADLERIIAERFSEEQLLSYREKVLAEHIQHAIEKQRHFIGKKDSLEKLDQFFDSAENVLVITGQSGCGKTALLAKWIKNLNSRLPETFLFFHFCGGASDSTNHIRILQRLVTELKEEFKIESEIPSESEKIIEIVPEFLARAKKPGEKWLLVIDGINQVDDFENAHLLNWLPQFFPPHVKVVLSCLEGDSLNVLKRRNVPLETLKGFRNEEQRQFIKMFLEEFGKKLPEFIIKEILSDDRSSNPLFLKTLLEEIRIFGLHEKLGQHIQRYLKTSDFSSFFDEVLQRMEEDYEENHPGLVGTVLGLIFSSRAGLSEKEILEITGIKPIYWSHFLNAIEAHLVSKSGLFYIGHDYLKLAIEKRFVPNLKDRKIRHQRLANYFKNNLLSPRSLIEYPYHLIESENYDLFEKYNSNPVILGKQIDLNKVGLMIWFTQVNTRQKIQKKILQKMRMDSFKDPKAIELILKIANFFNSMAYYKESIDLSSLVLKNLDGRKKTATYKTEALFIRGYSYHQTLKYNIALTDLENCLKNEKMLKPGNQERIARTLNQIGFTYHWKNEYRKAATYYKKALKIRRKIHQEDSIEVSQSYNHIGLIHNDEGNYKLALRYFWKSLNIRLKKLGEMHPDVSECHGNIGLMYHSLNQFAEANNHYQQAINIGKKIYGEIHPDISAYYNNLGLLFQDLGDLDNSMKYLQISLKAWQKVSKEDNIEAAISYNNIGWIFLIRKQYDKALEYYTKDFNISLKEYGEIHEGMIQSYSNIAKIFYFTDNLPKAFDYIQKCLICFKKGFEKIHPESTEDLCLLAMILLKMEKFSDALEQLNLAQEISKKRLGAKHLNNAMIFECYGQYYYTYGNPEQAEKYYLLALDLWKKKLPPIHYETADTLLLLGKLLLETGREKEARKYLKEARNCFEHFSVENEVEKIDRILKKK